MPSSALELDLTFWKDHLEAMLTGSGISIVWVEWISLATTALVLFVILGLLSKLLTRAFVSAFRRFAGNTETHFDDHLLDLKVPRYVARVIPLLIGYHLVPVALRDMPTLIPITERLFMVGFIILAIRIARAFMFAVRDTMQDNPTYRDKPLNSYVQVASLVLYFIGAILLFSLLTGRSALTFLTAMGAASAVLLLIFKDSILGFVASIQISTNDMVRIGDWITMPKYGADGDVTEINLTTVKVENFDKTITTIPTYALISDSFQNWRGMQQSGGRRIKRSILIKVNSIRFLDKAEIDALRSIKLLAPYIEERSAEIAQFNSERGLDGSMPVNGRRLTNAGLYRKYIDLYLAQHPGIHKSMTRMVRQQAPNEMGLPLELYCFTNTTDWLQYEGIMADIFDHLLAAHTYFNLVVFERPAADDMRNMGRPLSSGTSSAPIV
ncbi:MAG: mechanosensitive ion channel [Flavobacteriales bacterium]